MPALPLDPARACLSPSSLAPPFGGPPPNPAPTNLAASLQAEDIGHLEDSIRNRLVGRRGASGRAEKLAAKKSLFSNDEWSRILLYTAFMAREDEARAAQATRAAQRSARARLDGQVAEAEQRK